MALKKLIDSVRRVESSIGSSSRKTLEEKRKIEEEAKRKVKK